MGEGTPSFLLALNAAEGLLQFVVAREAINGEEKALVPLCAQSWHAPSQGAELLAPALRDALGRLHVAVSDIAGIACVRGPGSFTGVRLALATAAGLSRASGAAQAGLEYMPLLAESARSLCGVFLREGCRIWVMTHARRQLVHLQGFTGDECVKPLGGIQVVSPLEAVELIASQQSTEAAGALLLGSGVSRNRDSLREAFAEKRHPGIVFLPPSFDHPDTSVLLRAAEKAVYSRNDIEPLYVRPCDAEDNLERIAASLGLDPAEARRKLNVLRE